MPEILKSQVLTLVQDHVYGTLEDNSEKLKQFEHEVEIWEASPKREIQERFQQNKWSKLLHKALNTHQRPN